MRRRNKSSGGSSSTSCCSTSWSNYAMMHHNDDHDDDDDGGDDHHHHHLELGLSINNNNNNTHSSRSLFVKVYMEGHPIGRKLDILSVSGYPHLIATLDRMFNTRIISDSDADSLSLSLTHHHYHLLTYQDDEGDWMMVGDVPWELFLSAVKRLKISRACPTS